MGIVEFVCDLKWYFRYFNQDHWLSVRTLLRTVVKR